MDIKNEKNKNIFSNNDNKQIEIYNHSKKNEKLEEDIEKTVREKNSSFQNINYYENTNYDTNRISNSEFNENNNNIFIFYKNEDIEKNCNPEDNNNSYLSLIKVMEGNKKDNKINKKVHSSSCDVKNKKRNLIIDDIKNYCHKYIGKSLEKFSKRISLINKDEYNNSKNNILYLEETENTKIITTSHVRKIPISSNEIINDNNDIFSYRNNLYLKTDEIKKNPKHFGTRIDLMSNLTINNNISKFVNEIFLLSEKYIIKKGNKKIEIKDYSNKNVNINTFEKDIQYQHQNFYNRVCLDSIEELYEEENESKTKSKINSNKTSELSSFFLSEKKNNANSCQKFNKYKMNSITNSNIKNIIINNTPLISTKYNLGKNNNIFDISSDEDENDKKLNIKINDNNKIFNNNQNINNKLYNFNEEQNDLDSNLFVRPLDTFINSNEYETSNSFMNESDINKLFNSPSKKGINLIDPNSININSNNNNHILYNKNINNSAIFNKFSSKFKINYETDLNYNDNLNKENIELNNNQNYNKTYFKKSISKELFQKPYNLKTLISPENLNRYYSNNLNNNQEKKNNVYLINSNNNNQNVEIKDNSIKNFYKDNSIIKPIFNKNNLTELDNIFNITYINFIKNQKNIKNFILQNSNINKINVNLDYISIKDIEMKRKIINDLKTPNNIIKKDSIFNDNTLFTSEDKKNNFNNNLNFSNIRNRSEEEYICKIFMTNDSKTEDKLSKISKNKKINTDTNSHHKYIKNILEKSIIEEKPQPQINQFIYEENETYTNNNTKSNSNFYEEDEKLKHKRTKSRNFINRNNILFYNKSENLNDENINNKCINNKYINYSDDNKPKNIISLKLFVNKDKSKINDNSNLKNNKMNIIHNIIIKEKNNENKNKYDNDINDINDKDIKESKNNNLELNDLSKKNITKKKLYISKESYEELIKEFISKTQDLKIKSKIDNKSYILENNNEDLPILNSNILEKHNQKEIENNLVTFEHELKLLKNIYLCLLIKKHFLKKKSEKLKLIKDTNIINKLDLFNKSYENKINYIKEKFKFENEGKINIYYDKIINILKKYKNITKYEIKYTKKIYKEENDLSPYTLDIKCPEDKNNNLIENFISKDLNTKKIIISTSIILPIIYAINYLISFYN